MKYEISKKIGVNTKKSGIDFFNKNSTVHDIVICVSAMTQEEDI